MAAPASAHTHTLSVAKLDAVAWWQAVRTFCESTLVLSGPIESWSLDLVDGGVHGQSGFVGEDVCKEPFFHRALCECAAASGGPGSCEALNSLS